MFDVLATNGGDIHRTYEMADAIGPVNAQAMLQHCGLGIPYSAEDRQPQSVDWHGCEGSGFGRCGWSRLGGRPWAAQLARLIRVA